MINIEILTTTATLIGVPIGLVGLLLAYISLRKETTKVSNQINQTQIMQKETNLQLKTFTEIVNLHIKYSSEGSQFNDCTVVMNNAVSPEDIANSYKEGVQSND